MALKGTLTDFPIADIFQLIGQQQKTGSLFITHKDQIAHIMFEKGMVVVARFKKSHNELMIGNMLLNAHVISEDQLQEAIEDQQATLRSIGDILLSMKHISIQDLKDFLLLQVREVLFITFQWNEGLYEFIQEDFKLNPKLVSPQRAEQLLLDGYRMIDEWPGLLRKVVSLDAIYKPLMDSGQIMVSQKVSDEVSIDQEIDQAFSEFEEQSSEYSIDKKTNDFNKEEKEILGIVDGYRTIREIAALSKKGTFDACYTLASLIDKGAITKLESSADSRLDQSAIFQPVFVTKRQKRLQIITDLLVLFVAFLFLPFSVYYFSSVTTVTVSKKQNFYTERPASPLKKLVDSNELDKIKFALELYRFRNNSYPLTLSQLVDEKLINLKTTDKNFYYKRTPDRYFLLR